MALSKITNASVADTAVHGRRNLIINGAMQVAQRGTSFSSITGSTYTLDRFAVRNATAVSQSTDVPSGEGFAKSLFYDNDGTRSSINVRQVIEDATRLLNDTPCTLSFWAKGSASASCSVDLADTNITGFALTTDWVKYEITFPATSNINSGNIFEAGAVWVDFNFGGSYPDVYLTGVQLELGDTATPFEHRSFSEELLACQRFYYMSWPYGTSTSTDLTGDNNNLGILMNINDAKITMGQAFLPVAMRVIPTVSVRSPSGVSGKFYDYQSDTDLNFSLTGSQIQPSASAIVVYEYDGSATPNRPAYVHIFCDAEL